MKKERPNIIVYKDIILSWNSYFQKYYSIDHSFSLTLEEYEEYLRDKDEKNKKLDEADDLTDNSALNV